MIHLSANIISKEINTLHRDASKAASTALEHAKKCGELLIQAKAEVGHGNWEAWVAENLEFQTTQAWRYMRIAKEWKAISANLSSKKDLPSIEEAVALVAEPRVAKPTPLQKLETQIEKGLDELYAGFAEVGRQFCSFESGADESKFARLRVELGKEFGFGTQGVDFRMAVWRSTEGCASKLRVMGEVIMAQWLNELENER